MTGYLTLHEKICIIVLLIRMMRFRYFLIMGYKKWTWCSLTYSTFIFAFKMAMQSRNSGRQDPNEHTICVALIKQTVNQRCSVIKVKV